MIDADESFWHPDDKAWMKQRKEDWKPIKSRLDLISGSYHPFKRKYHKYHKELFLTGILNPEIQPQGYRRNKSCPDDWQYNGHDAFDTVLPFFKFWYHPEPEAVNIDAYLKHYLVASSLRMMQNQFFKDYFSVGSSYNREMYSAAEGMMNGREELMVKLLCPGVDYKNPFITSGNAERDVGQRECLSPKDLEMFLRSHSYLELQQDARHIPYAPGQYLWDHFSYTLEKYPDEVFVPSRNPIIPREELRRRFLQLIATVLDFESRTDKSRHRPSTIAFVEGLISKYEKKAFSDAMLSLWDEAKQDVKNLVEEARPLVNFTEKELDDRYMSVEVQRERISQWKQVP